MEERLAMSEALPSPSPDTPDVACHRRWRDDRLAELGASDSWLGVVGLCWLEPGANAVGSAPDCPVRLPDGPLRLGVLACDGSAVVWQATGGLAGPLRTDAGGEPDRVRCGSHEFFVIERDGRLAVRLRDLDWRRQRHFAGIDCYAYDPDWRIDAVWETLPVPATMVVPTMTGELKTVEVRHRAVFDCAGERRALLPMEAGDDGVFFVFRDATSGLETYGGGRFLRAPLPADGRLVLDFNFAYNPPCAFTAFAACPLPPPENRLPLAVLAGERRYAGPH